MLEADKINDGRRAPTGLRGRHAAAAWTIACSLLFAFILLFPNDFGDSGEQATGRVSGVSVSDRTQFLSLGSRDGLRQSVSAERKSGPHARLDSPVIPEIVATLAQRYRVERIAFHVPAARLGVDDPSGYDCRGPPFLTT
ncbi:hypothetical protein [Rhizobium sp.]